MFRAGIAVLALTLATAATAATADPEELLRAADAPHDAFAEGVIHLRVTAKERGKKPVENVLDLHVKGGDKNLCVFRGGKQKGRKILTLGDRVWLIVPGASRPIPVSSGQRLMGAASFGDIARMRFADVYDATLRPSEQAVGETACRVLDLKAKEKRSAYPSGILWTGKDDGLARRLRLALASGKEAKEVLFEDYGAGPRIGTMEIRDLLAAGGENVTTLVFESYEPRTLDPAIFDLDGARALP